MFVQLGIGSELWASICTFSHWYACPNGNDPGFLQPRIECFNIFQVCGTKTEKRKHSRDGNIDEVDIFHRVACISKNDTWG